MSIRKADFSLGDSEGSIEVYLSKENTSLFFPEDRTNWFAKSKSYANSKFSIKSRCEYATLLVNTKRENDIGGVHNVWASLSVCKTSSAANNMFFNFNNESACCRILYVGVPKECILHGKKFVYDECYNVNISRKRSLTVYLLNGEFICGTEYSTGMVITIYNYDKDQEVSFYRSGNVASTYHRQTSLLVQYNDDMSESTEEIVENFGIPSEAIYCVSSSRIKIMKDVQQKISDEFLKEEGRHYLFSNVVESIPTLYEWINYENAREEKIVEQKWQSKIIKFFSYFFSSGN